MSKSPHESDALVGKDLLIEVATQLFMERGYDGVSIQEIASAAQMTKGSPYYHFKNKEDIFLQAHRTNVCRINERFLASLREAENLRQKLIDAFVHMLTANDAGVIRMLDDYHRLFVQRGMVGINEISEPPFVMHKAYEELFVNSGEALRWSSGMLADALVAMQLGILHLRIMHADNPNLGANHESVVAAAEAQQIAADLIDLFLDGARRHES